MKIKNIIFPVCLAVLPSISVAASLPTIDDYRSLNNVTHENNGYYIAGKWNYVTQNFSIENRGDTTLTLNGNAGNQSPRSYSIALGYYWDPAEFSGRLELEYNRHGKFTVVSEPLYSNLGVNASTEVNNQSIFLNFYYDFEPWFWGLSWYGNIGLGYNINDATTISSVPVCPECGSFTSDNRNSRLTYGIGLGTRKRISKLMYLDFRFRYLDLGSNNLDLIKSDQGIGPIKVSTDAIEVGIGLTINFGDLFRCNEI